MKNKVFLFWVSIFLGSLLVPLHAMPPKPFVKGKVSEEKDNLEKKIAEDQEERGRELRSGIKEDTSGMEQRGEKLGAMEDLDFSPDKLDETLIVAQKAKEECEVMLGETVVSSLDDARLKEVSRLAKEQTTYWAKQKRNASTLLSALLKMKENASTLLSARLERREASAVEEEQQLASVLASCREVWLKWDDLFSEVESEIDKRELGVTTDEDLQSDTSSVTTIEKSMVFLKLTGPSTPPGGGMIAMSTPPAVAASRASMSYSLKGRLENFLATLGLDTSLPTHSIQFSFAGTYKREIGNQLTSLLQQAQDETTLHEGFMRILEREGTKIRNRVKKEVEDSAALNYKQAEREYRQTKILTAHSSYCNAIAQGEQAIQIWSEIEMLHTMVRDVVGLKVRRLGMRIKETLKQEVRSWQAKLDQIELDQKNNIDRVVKKRNSLQAEREHVLKLEKEVEVQNEVGTTCRVIAGNLATMIKHLQAAEDAYSKYDRSRGSESEKIVDEIHQEVELLKPHLETRLNVWREWKKRNFEPQEIETDAASQKSVWKMRFMGPLIRKEFIPTSGVEPEHELEMAAEYLMVVLNSNQSEEAFCNDLAARGYPGSQLEAVSKEDSLYRLYFQPDQNFQHPLLQTMDALKNTIQENHLAVRCYPDYMIELDSSIATPLVNAPATAAVPEPWAFYHDKGLHPPAELLDVPKPLLSAPPTPIKVAIIDTGVFGSIDTGAFETHDALAGKIACTFDERRKRATGFGFNACDPLHPTFPEDLNGHGTHVAGIVAATHGVIDGVAGLAGMPGFVQLIICKLIQPGSKKGFCSDAIKCIKYAEQQGAKFINCSWGRRLYSAQNTTGGTPEEIQDLENSVKDKQFVVVASAGNRLSETQSPVDVDQINRYPCNFALSNLISVAGTGKKGQVPNNFSNFGKKSVQLAAPGKSIISTWIGAPKAYKDMTGTSQAAPYVTAAAVLAKIQYPFLEPRQLARYLCYACDGGSADDMQVKHGPLNLTNVLSIQKMREFLKSQKLSDQQIEELFNPKKGKKK